MCVALAPNAHLLIIPAIYREDKRRADHMNRSTVFLRAHPHERRLETIETVLYCVVRESLEVKLVDGLEGDKTFILCRSQDRREKEKAMHDRFEQ